MDSTTPTELGSSSAIPFLYSHIATPFLILLLSALFFNRLRNKFSNQTTPLNGPANTSSLFGLSRHITETKDKGNLYEEWASKYGPAFRVPDSLGSSRIFICDPKASAHFHSKATVGYIRFQYARYFIETQLGRGLIWAEGESHRRQRKALSPAFSNTALRKLTSVFYDNAYKMKSMWDSTLDAGRGQAVIDVQMWMSHFSLDSIGIAGFGHDFRALHGEQSPVMKILESSQIKDTGFLSQLVVLLGPVIPILQKLPTKRNRRLKQMKGTMGYIADELLARIRKEMEAGSLAEDKSIIGLLVKAESTGSSLGLSREEVLAQNTLLLAGFETTSASLTWALIELARNPEKQQRLRDELSQFAGSDPTFDQLSASLPYLESVTHEILRLHPAVLETTRMAAEDDIMPFSQPVTTASGETVSSIVIKKGELVTSPIRYMNRAETFWGPNAKEFVPERWLEDDPCSGAREIQGHKHILTFTDGTRMCLGRGFALAEFKAVMSVLIRNYTFELPDGPSTVIEVHPSAVPRAKVAGQVGAQVPMIIKRVE